VNTEDPFADSGPVTGQPPEFPRSVQPPGVALPGAPPLWRPLPAAGGLPGVSLAGELPLWREPRKLPPPCRETR